MKFVDDSKHLPAVVGELGCILSRSISSTMRLAKGVPSAYAVVDDSMEPGTYNAFKISGLSNTNMAGDAVTLFSLNHYLGMTHFMSVL